MREPGAHHSALPAAECSRGPRYRNIVSVKLFQRFHLGQWGTVFSFIFSSFFFHFPQSGHISPFFSDLIFRIKNLNDY